MTLWMALVGCSILEGACEGTGLSGCSEPLVPLEGPWVADFGNADACGVDGPSLREGWSVTASGDADFALTPPAAAGAGEATPCVLAGASFTCEPALMGGDASVVVTGALGSRSTADITVTVTDGSCEDVRDIGFVAAWKAAGPPAGQCPNSYDRYEDPPQPLETISFAIVNQSDTDYGLFDISAGEVFVNPVPAGAVLQASSYKDGWMALATDWGEENCVWLFQVREVGHIEVFEGE